MFQLTKQTALITGATGGLGSAIARVLLSQGAKVVLSGTREVALLDLKNTLLENFPSAEIFVCPANLSDGDQASLLFNQAEDLAGPIDILVNNAGITRDNFLMRMKDEEWNDVITLNLTSCFKLSRAAVKKMMSRRYGRIINITSVVATMGNAGQTNYCAAKAGLIGFSKALAKEIASRNITVNCVAPGFIDTAMTQDLSDTIKAQIAANIPLGRMGCSDDIAYAVAYLASPAASYVTGQTLHVNGGLDMI